MGGGTSGLYFGTKGSRQEYQYSFFPDLIRKDTLEPIEGIGNSGLQSGSEAKSHLKKHLITIQMVLKKCLEYHAGIITAQQLVEWLSFVITAPTYRIEHRLRDTIVNAVCALSTCLSLDSISAFEQELAVFENQLNRLKNQ